ncbi:MAG: hypothetical protein EOP44_05740 [Sphingobacteriaceae bacterium]|nr:MAG: hypothetical protein EOP44_05740 [Sphingobacteriaceae bacterium]
MISQSAGKIFLAEERGHNELNWFRSFNTFNFGSFYNEHKHPFESLYILNEDTLAGNRKISMLAENDSCIVLIPVVGAISFKDSAGNSGLLQAGQAQVLNVYAGTTLEISNPYEEESVNFLQIWIKTPDLQSTVPQLFEFDLDKNPNQLLELFSPQKKTLVKTVPQPHGVIGKFSGRSEAVYNPAQSGNALFAYVIEGNVEVQYRLMNPRDGLGLWDLEEMELEALSENAIVLILEIPVLKTV